MHLHVAMLVKKLQGTGNGERYSGYNHGRQSRQLQYGTVSRHDCNGLNRHCAKPGKHIEAVWLKEIAVARVVHAMVGGKCATA